MEGKPDAAPLAADNVRVVRGARTILDDVSVSIRYGLTAVIGPNGAGKSTLLSVLAGVQRPDSGEVALNGVPIDSISRGALALQRAYLPQNARCEWPIAVARVVALGLTPVLPALGDLSAVDTARVEAALAAWDLEALRDQSALTLSGGELTRTMLARALVNDPGVLIADEPIAGLDPRHALDAMKRLGERARAGRTVIMAIHDLGLAARYADHVIALKQGRVFAAGATREVLTAETLGALFEVAFEVNASSSGLEVKFLP